MTYSKPNREFAGILQSKAKLWVVLESADASLEKSRKIKDDSAPS